MTGQGELANLRFLVVDDDRAIIEVVDALLQLAGATAVYKATSVAAAISIAAEPQNKFDCIISDYGMLPANGLEFLQKVRSAAYEGIPREMHFVMLTAHGQEAVVRTAMELDVSGYIVKPVTKYALVRAIYRAFNRALSLKSAEVYGAIALPPT